MFIVRVLVAGLLLLVVTPLNALQFTKASTTVGLGGELAVVESELDQAVVVIQHAACITTQFAVVQECTGDQTAHYTDDFISWHWFDEPCEGPDQYGKGLHWANPDDGPSIDSQSTDQCPS